MFKISYASSLLLAYASHEGTHTSENDSQVADESFVISNIESADAAAEAPVVADAAAGAHVLAGAVRDSAADDRVVADAAAEQVASLDLTTTSPLTRTMRMDAKIISDSDTPAVEAALVSRASRVARETSYLDANRELTALLPVAAARRQTEENERQVTEYLANPSSVAPEESAEVTERRIAGILGLSVADFRANRASIEEEFMLAQACDMTVEEMYRTDVMAWRQIEEEWFIAGALGDTVGRFPPPPLHHATEIDSCLYCLELLSAPQSGIRACGHLRHYGNASPPNPIRRSSQEREDQTDAAKETNDDVSFI